MLDFCNLMEQWQEGKSSATVTFSHRILETYSFFQHFEKYPIIRFIASICRYYLFLWGGILYFFVISPMYWVVLKSYILWYKSCVGHHQRKVTASIPSSFNLFPLPHCLSPFSSFLSPPRERTILPIQFVFLQMFSEKYPGMLSDAWWKRQKLYLSTSQRHFLFLSLFTSF